MVHWGLSDKNADTKEIERVAVDAAAQIHLSGTVWVVVDEHYILFTSTIAQLCERSSRNVACQSSSYLQRASILIQSNCCLTT